MLSLSIHWLRHAAWGHAALLWHPEELTSTLRLLRVRLQERFEEGYGAVLDSGTTFTYLPSEAFVLFRDAVSAYALSHGLHSTKGPDPKVWVHPFWGLSSFTARLPKHQSPC
jgi:hypothetical protein